jgi:hypothetical protein
MIANADRVIERFGGIRPMANKLGVPVTTVQGWKKRGVIPANRAALIEQAAVTHGVETTGLIHIISGDVTTRISLPQKPKMPDDAVISAPEVDVIEKSAPVEVSVADQHRYKRTVNGKCSRYFGQNRRMRYTTILRRLCQMIVPRQR